MSLGQNYLTPEFLHLLLFDQARIVLKYFDYQKSWDNIFQLLTPFYRFEDLDAREFNNPDFLPIYLQQLSEGFVRPFLFIPVADPKVLDPLQKQQNLPFITVLEKPDFTYDFSVFRKWVLYDNKTDTFIEKHLQRDALKEKQTMGWINDQLMPKIRSSLVEATNYLSLIKNTMETLFELTADFHPEAYRRLIKPFESQEEFVIFELTEIFYQIDLREIRKILAKTEMVRLEKEKVEEKLKEKYSESEFEGKESTMDLTEEGGAEELMAFLTGEIEKAKEKKEITRNNTSAKPSEKSKDEQRVQIDQENISMGLDFSQRITEKFNELQKKFRCSPKNMKNLQDYSAEIENRIKYLLNR